MRGLRTTTWIGLSGAAILHAGLAGAQPRPQFLLEYHYLRDSQLKAAIPGLPNSGDVKFAVSTVDFAAALPFLVAGAEGDVVQRMFRADFLVDSKQLEETIFTMEEEDFVALGARLEFVQRLSSRWHWTGFGGLELAVDDLGQAQPEDLTYQGGMLFVQRTYPELEWGVGAMFSQITGSDFVLPLVHLDWRPAAERVRVRLVVPPDLRASRASVSYSMLEGQFTAGVVGEFAGDEYHFTSTEQDLLDAQGNVVAADVSTALAFAEVIVGPEFVVRTGSGLELGFLVGASTGRRFEFRAPDEDATLRIPGESGSFPEADFELQSIFTLKLTAAYGF